MLRTSRKPAIELRRTRWHLGGGAVCRWLISMTRPPTRLSPLRAWHPRTASTFYSARPAADPMAFGSTASTGDAGNCGNCTQRPPADRGSSTNAGFTTLLRDPAEDDVEGRIGDALCRRLGTDRVADFDRYLVAIEPGQLRPFQGLTFAWNALRDIDMVTVGPEHLHLDLAEVRGVNVGGHRAFRPAALAEQLKHVGAVNIGAAGTFVIRQPMAPTRLRAELACRLPFETEIVTCPDRGDREVGVTGRLRAPSGTPRYRPFRKRPVSTASCGSAIAVEPPLQRPLAGEGPRARWPAARRSVSAPDEDHRLPRYAGPGLRGPGHDAQLEYHHRHREGAGDWSEPRVVVDAMTLALGRAVPGPRPSRLRRV